MRRAPQQQLAVLRGELVRFSRRTDDGWGVGTLRIAPAGEDDFDDGCIEITGKVLDAVPGDALELHGSWVEHPRFGRQFKIKQCVAAMPVSEEGVVSWLAATLPGIGDMRARQLVARFGGPAKLWETIEHSPAQLAQVDGITDARAREIHDVYMANRATRDSMVALRGWGLTDAQIQRCVDQWHTIAAVVENVRANPYQLARYVHGFGFLRADEVAGRMGIRHNDPRRIEAGIVHTLDDATTRGHCWVWGGALQKIAAETLKVDVDDVARGIMHASAHSMIRRRGKRIYSARMDTHESRTANAAARILSGRVVRRGDEVDRHAPPDDNGRTLH
jgi:exodeoxyribonuclease V alpha subunit